MLSEKVVKLNHDNTGEQIERFIKTIGLNSEETGKSYLKDIKRFFEVVKGKDVKYLTKDDVQLTLDDFEDFVHYLQQKVNLNPKTINHNVSAVAELMRYLASKDSEEEDDKGNKKKIVEDISYLTQLKRVRLKENKNSHGVLSLEEALKMSELALEEKDNPEIKSKLILFSLDTCMRKSACLDLKWTDFEVKDNDVLVKAVDKGNKDFRPRISKEFYNQLLEIKTCDNEYVFSIGKGSIDNMMDRLRNKMGIPEERNIVFHSFRKAGAVFQYRLTGDIKKAQAALGHSHSVTTDIYLEDEKEGILGAISSGGSIDTEIYKDISHEDLLKAINLLPQSAKFNLALKIKEVVNITENN